jgi:xylose isomerase
MKEKYTLRNKNGRNGLGAGVWNIEPGADPFGGPTRDYPDSGSSSDPGGGRDNIFRSACSEIPLDQVEADKTRAEEFGLRCGMYTPSFFADPVLKDGAMSSNDLAIRKVAVENGKRAIDATLALEAPVVVFWNCREGFDFVLAKNGQDAFKRLIEALQDERRNTAIAGYFGKCLFGH